MARQTTDNLYIELGYFTPEEYYTYEARASAANAVVASLSADAGVIRQGDSSQSVVTSITATISNIKGVDIVLAPFASVTADAVVTRDAQSSQSSTATQTTSSDRLRDFAISLSDAFAFAVIADGGNVQNASASISSAITQTAVGNLVADIISTQSSEFSQTAAATVTRDLSSSQTVTASQSTLGGVIYEQSSTITDAFSVTMAVNVTVNPFATLETAAIMTTDFVVNRSAAITLNNIVSLSSQGVRSAGLTSTISAVASQTTQATRTANLVSTPSSAFTQTASATRIKEFSTALTSAFTVTASGLDIDLASASLTVSSSLSANLTIFYPNYTWYQRNYSVSAYNTSRKVFGTASARVLLTGVQTPYLELLGNDAVSSSLLYPGSQNFTIEFWTGWEGGSDTGAITYLDMPNGITITRLSSGVLRATIQNTSLTTVTLTGTGTFQNSLGEMRHIALVRSGDTFSLYANSYNGAVREATQTSAGFGAVRTPTDFTRLYGKTTFDSAALFDEFRISIGIARYSGSTYTVPTTAFVRDNYTRALSHFDQTFDVEHNNDILTGNATVSAVATLSGSAVRTRTTSSSMSANGFVVTVAGYRVDDLADLSPTSTMTAAVNRIASGQSTQTATASLTALGGYRKQFSSEPFVEFHVDVTANEIYGFVVSLSSTATESADAERLRGVTAQLAAEGFTLIVAGTQQTATADLSSAFTVTAQANRTRDLSSSVSSSASMSVTVGEIVQYSATLASAVTQTSSGDRIRLGVTSITAQAAQTATAIKTADSTASVNTSASVTASVVRTRESPTSVYSEISLTAVPNYQASYISNQSAQAQQTAQGNYTAKGSMNGSAIGFVIAVTAYTSTTNSDMHCESTMSVSAVKTASANSAQTASATLSTQPTRIQQYVRDTVTGVTARPYRWLQYVDDAIETEIVQANVVFSFWARRPDLLETENTFIWNRSRIPAVTQSPPQVTHPYNTRQLKLHYINDAFLFTAYDEIGSGNNAFFTLTWNNAIVNDTEWHHYLVKVNTWSGAFPGNFQVRLWRDGEDLSHRTASGPNTYGLTVPFFSPMDIGYNSLIDLAQIWIGPQATVLDPSLFYNSGYQDLGTTGQVNGYTPLVYTKLTEPFDTELQGVIGTAATPPNSETTETVSTGYSSTYRLRGDSSQSQMSVIAQAVQVFNVQYNSAFTVTAETRKTAVSASTQSASAQLQSLTAVNKPFNANLSSAFSITPLTGNILSAQSTQSAQFTATVDGDKINAGVINLSSAFTVLAISGTRADAQSSQTAVSTMTVSADKVKDVFISVGSNCSTSASAIKTASAQFSQTAQAALNCTADKIRGTRIDIASDSALSTQPRKTARGISTQSAVFTQISNVGQIKGTSANLSALYATLTVGRVIHLDPYLTYVIDPETRIFKITEESRIYTIDAETRVNIIQGYNQ